MVRSFREKTVTSDHYAECPQDGHRGSPREAPVLIDLERIPRITGFLT